MEEEGSGYRKKVNSGGRWEERKGGKWEVEGNLKGREDIKKEVK